jgi:gluconolactonase
MPKKERWLVLTAALETPMRRALIAVLIFGPLSTIGVAQATQLTQPEIRHVIRAGTRIELIKDGFHGLEGPVPTPDGGLYFSAIDENRIYKLDKDGSLAVWRENTSAINGLYLRKDGYLLCAEGNGPRIISIAPGGAVSVLASGYAGKPLRQPNDLIADRKGGIYFTDPAPRPAPGVAAKEPGNVHYIRPRGEVLLIDDKITRPNGITLSLDENTLYVDDTEGLYVYAFDVQPDGSATNKRPFTKLRDPESGSLGLRSRADGMALDSDGRLYVATASGVQVIDRGGKYLGTIRLPAVARNLAFAGPDRRTLYLTALNALYRVSLLSRGPPDRAK